MYKCVVFDMDGTVLNTLDDLADSGNYALSELGLPVHEVDKYRYFVGNGIPKLIERILPEDKRESCFDETYELFRTYYAEHMYDKTAPYEGIIEALKKLKTAGKKLVLVSNKSHEFALEMAKRFFGDLFDIIYGSFPDKPKKPDPYFTLKALDELGFSREEAFYVGDSSVDMQTAKNAGLTACGVLWGFRGREELLENGADFICADTDELVSIILQ